MKRIASAVAQDYLKLIWSAKEWHKDEPVTTSMLAARQGVSASTASEAVKRLRERGLVRTAPYAAIELTPEGERLALAMVRRHRLVETFLVATLGFAWDEAHDDAEILEHAASDRFIAALDDFLGHPRRDPHGDPIPADDGSVTHPAAHPLSQTPAGAVAVVERISDADPAMLRYFASVGLMPDATVEVVERRDFAGVMVLAVVSGAPEGAGAGGGGAIGDAGVKGGLGADSAADEPSRGDGGPAGAAGAEPAHGQRRQQVELGDIAAAAVWVSQRSAST